jgi:hypothetical protein
MLRTLFTPSSARLTAFLRSASLVLLAAIAIPLAAYNTHFLTNALADVQSGRDHGGDYIAFYAAGILYSAHQDGTPYDIERLRETELAANPSLLNRGDWTSNRLNPFRNPPFYLPLLGYLAHFPLAIGFATSTVLEGALLAVLLVITAWVVGSRASPAAAATWILVGMAYSHVWQGLAYGQIPSYTVALAFTAGILLLRAGRPVIAGMVLALLWLKLQYLAPLALFLFLSKERKALLSLLGGSAILMLLSVASVGLDGMRKYAETTLQLAVAPRELYFASFSEMYNWRGILERAIGPTYPDIVFPVQLVLIVLTYTLAIWAWTAPTKGSAWRRDAQLMLLALTMVVASPHVHGQDMVLLLPAVALLASYLWREAVHWLVTPTSGLAMLLILWWLPQPSLLGPGLHFGAMLLVLLFFALVLVLRMAHGRVSVVRSIQTSPANQSMLSTRIGSQKSEAPH